MLWYDDLNKLVVRIKASDPTCAILRRCNPEGEQSYGNDVGFLFTVTRELCQILVNLKYLEVLLVTDFWQGPHKKIDGKYTPMAHQLLTAAFIIFNPRCYILSDCRLGKTGAAITAFDYILSQQMITGGVLVITTLTTVKSVWERSIIETLPNHNVAIIHGKRSLDCLQRPYDWYITNYDSIRLHKKLFAAAIDTGLIRAILIDEITHLGNSRSQRSLAIQYLANATKIQYVVGMTGSPGSDPEPVFGMAKAINPCKLPVRTKTAWLSLTTIQVGPYTRKPARECASLIHQVLQPSIRFKKSDVLDLPPVTTQDRMCDLSAEQTKALKDLRDQACILVDNNEPITAANGGVLVSKLLQVALGFVFTNDKNIISYNCDKRNQTILEAIKESQYKTVIFNIFKHRIEVLRQFLAAAGVSVEVITGSVTGEERAKILHSFTNTDNPQVLICHPTTVGFGTELARADTLILDGPPLLLGDFSYMQTIERLSSPKQQADHINIVRVMATREERTFFSRLAQGQKAGEVIAAMFEQLRS